VPCKHVCECPINAPYMMQCVDERWDAAPKGCSIYSDEGVNDVFYYNEGTGSTCPGEGHQLVCAGVPATPTLDNSH
jgi:hypothetical protein